MNYEEIIHFIEDKQISIEEKDYFYHAFAYDQNEFINMLNNGIKSPILLGKSGSGLNGNFYVSLSKKENYETQSSINKQLFYLPTFVINDKLKAVKAINCTKIKKIILVGFVILHYLLEKVYTMMNIKNFFKCHHKIYLPLNTI